MERPQGRVGDLRVVRRRQRLDRPAAALEVERRRPVDERDVGARPLAGTAGGRPRRDAATGSRRRTGWPGRRRPGARSRARPARGPVRGPRAAARARRPARTGPRRARRRSSRAGSGRPPRASAGSGRPPRSRPRRPRSRPPRGSRPRAGRAARAPSRGVARSGVATPSSTSDQRPAASGGPSDVSRPGRRRTSRAGRFQRSARSGANVSFVTSPAQTRSQSASSTSRSEPPPAAREDLAVERGAPPAEELADRLVAGTGGAVARRRAAPSGRSGLAAGPDERDPAVVAAEAPPPDPGDLAHRPELVEQPRLVARDPRRQDVPLEHGRRDRQAGELVDDLGEALERGRRPELRGGLAERGDAVPGGQEPAERGRVDRLDLAAQPGQRPPAEEAEDLGVEPLALRAARPELAAEDRAVREQPLEARPRRRRPAAPSGAPAPGSGTGRGSGRTGRAGPRAPPAAGPRNASGTPAGGATPTPSR